MTAMEYDIKRILADVRTAIDENTDISPFTDESGAITDIPTLEMDDIIKSKISDAINIVRSIAQTDKLQVKTATANQTWTDEIKHIGQVTLPQDYMRFVSFKMSDWLYPVTKLLPTDSNLYAQQFSEWGGLRGTPSKPIAAIANISGNMVLQFFSCKSNTATNVLSYIPYVKADNNTTKYDIEETIYRAVVLKAAELTASSYGNVNMMNILEAKMRELLGYAPDKEKR